MRQLLLLHPVDSPTHGPEDLTPGSAGRAHLGPRLGNVLLIQVVWEASILPSSDAQIKSYHLLTEVLITAKPLLVIYGSRVEREFSSFISFHMDWL